MNNGNKNKLLSLGSGEGKRGRGIRSQMVINTMILCLDLVMKTMSSYQIILKSENILIDFHFEKVTWVIT